MSACECEQLVVWSKQVGRTFGRSATAWPVGFLSIQIRLRGKLDSTEVSSPTPVCQKCIPCAKEEERELSNSIAKEGSRHVYHRYALRLGRARPGHVLSQQR